MVYTNLRAPHFFPMLFSFTYQVRLHVDFPVRFPALEELDQALSHRAQTTRPTRAKTVKTRPPPCDLG
ncbi:hypothetical protein [Actinacidiphila sp. bgisy167]|uniref:hypothetical protein n=1 Tax=Actinacidiphila sp. bgisy167 TaxID=3413797 RepID=UPI003D70D8FC